MTGTPVARRADVVVVGGGVAGLVVAHDLARAGRRVVVLEADGRVGGCVAPLELAGLRLDAGAESFATRTTAVADLLAGLGLADDVEAPAARGSWARLVDRAVPLPRAGMLGVPADPFAPDVRAALGLAGSLRAALDRVLPARVGVPAGPVSLAAVVRARMGRRVLERLVAPVVTGVHASDPADVDLDAALPGVRAALAATGSLGAAVGRLRAQVPAGQAAAGLRGGMNRLPVALAEAIRAADGEVRTEAAVDAVEILEPASDGARWTVRCGDLAWRARDVVVAAPAPVAARLLGGLVPEVGSVVAAAPPDPDVVIATLVLDAPELDAAPRGTGVLVAPDVTAVSAKGLTHGTAKWGWLARAAGPGVHVVRLSYGRAGRPVAPDRATTLADASALLGVPLREDQVRGWAATRWTTGLPTASPGHRERVARVRAAVALRPGLAVAGAWVAGTGLAAVVADARAVAGAVVADGEPGPGA